MAEMRGSIRHLVLIAMTPQAFGVDRELQHFLGASWDSGAPRVPCPGEASS